MEVRDQQQTTDHQGFRHGSSSSHQTLDQTHLPFQYSLRPRREHPPLNPDPAPPPDAAAAAPSSQVRYRECLRNHAAKSGGHVLDGCGEFMPSGEDGTPDSFKCAACECHRSFHRRELEVDAANGRLKRMNHAPPAYFEFNRNNIHYSPVVGTHTAPVMMAFGGSAEAPAESSSDGTEASGQPKKRFRTKFSGEQKGKMMEFANKLGWKIQKHDEQQVHQFCTEIGVKREIFKVWMHNNKQPTKNVVNSSSG